MHFQKKADNPILAFVYLNKGLKLLFHKSLRPFLWLPVLINLLLYSLVFAISYFYLGDMINRFIPVWLQWLHWLLWPLFFLCFFIGVFFSFTVLANLLAAPFYGRLSAKTLALLNSENVAAAELPIAKVMAAEFNRAGYFAFRAVPLLIITLIPGFNLITPLLWTLFGAWGMVLEYMAYPMENAGVLFIEQKRLLRSVKLWAFSFGGLTALCLAVPLLNIFIAPAAVIGATLYFHDMKND